MKSYFMNEYGYPHLLIYENGEIYNFETKRFSQPDKRGIIVLTASKYKNSNRTKDTRFWPIWRFYFDSPWAKNLIYKNLNFLGFSKYFITIDGRLWGFKLSNYLKWSSDIHGYLFTALTDDNGIIHNTVRAHRLVAYAFVPNDDPINLNIVNHKDGIKTHNHASNLEWTDTFGNALHARNTGLVKTAFTDNQIHEICRRLENNERRCDISRAVGVPYHNIRIIERGGWRHIAKHYNIPGKKT